MGIRFKGADNTCSVKPHTPHVHAFSDCEKCHCGILSMPPLPELSERYISDTGEPSSLQSSAGGGGGTQPSRTRPG